MSISPKLDTDEDIYLINAVYDAHSIDKISYSYTSENLIDVERKFEEMKNTYNFIFMHKMRKFDYESFDFNNRELIAKWAYNVDIHTEHSIKELLAI